MVQISEDVHIPDSELGFTTSRSSGPGGQNVNKVSTKVTLLWDVANSLAVSDEQRALVRERLAGRINKQGVLRVSSERHRTQLANREAVVRRFTRLLAKALSEEATRVSTSVPVSVKHRRIQDKRQRGRLKRERAEDFGLDE